MSIDTEAGQRRRRRVELTPMPSIPVEFTAWPVPLATGTGRAGSAS
jgi:hypothetical protein